MKFGNACRHLKLFYVIILLILGSVSAFAQAPKPKISPDEAKEAKKIEVAKTFPEKITAAGDFLKKYPKSELRKQLNGFLAAQVFASKDDNQSVTNSQSFREIFTDPAESDVIIPALIDALVRLKRLDEAFAEADKYLPRHEDDVTVRLQLSIEGANQMRANIGKYATQTKDYSGQAIQLIEGDKKPASMTDEDWKEYQTKWLTELYISLGFSYLSLNDHDTARVCFEKAVSIDQNNITGWYMFGTLVDEGYQDLAKKYTVATGSGKSDLLSKANEKLDKVIEIFAHVVALTDGNPSYQPLNAQVKQDLESYYKYRHNNSTTGLQDLINKFKSAKTN